MSHGRRAAITVACGVTALAAIAGPAEAAPQVGTRVSAVACLRPGTTANCLTITAKDGTVYNVTAMTPKPRASGHAIWLRGTVTDKLSMCNEGVVLDRIRWTRTRQKCPN